MVTFVHPSLWCWCLPSLASSARFPHVWGILTIYFFFWHFSLLTSWDPGYFGRPSWLFQSWFPGFVMVAIDHVYWFMAIVCICMVYGNCTVYGKRLTCQRRFPWFPWYGNPRSPIFMMLVLVIFGFFCQVSSCLRHPCHSCLLLAFLSVDLIRLFLLAQLAMTILISWICHGRNWPCLLIYGHCLYLYGVW